MTGWEDQFAKLSPAKRALLERLKEKAAVQAAASVGIVRREGGGPAPLSFAQQRLWLVHQLDPGSYAFNVPRGLRLHGTLDIPALEWSLNELIRRHEVLRTVFVHTEAGTLVQTPVALAPVRLAVNEVAEGELFSEALAEFRLPFDLERGPLLRARLWKTGPEEYALLLVLHHIVSDAWTAGILFREIGELYRAARAGLPSPLPELPVQYADYAVWENKSLSGRRLEGEISWWMRQLEGAPPALTLPTDFPRPSVETSQGALEAFPMPLSLLEKLREFSRQEGTTVFMTALAAYSLLLSRSSGLADIVTGTDFSNRTHVETEKLIGFFINLLPIRIRLAGDPTFRELVGRAREAALAAYSHSTLPFEKLVEAMKPERVPSRHPLVQVLLVMQNIPRAKPEMGDLRVSDFDIPIVTSKFDLAVFLEEKPEGLMSQWVYHAGLFSPATIRTLARRLETLLANALAAPGLRVSALEMVGESEKREAEEAERKAKQSKSKRLMTTTPAGVGFGPVPKREL